ncbi:MAG: fibronectin type III domain-containing protein [Planctomycetes bacterium]|nr:fibronectin type III domain-containing protein [Planctomycetota bacterium]
MNKSGWFFLGTMILIALIYNPVSLLAQDNSQTKTEYGSTVTITGPFNASISQTYTITLSATTDANIYQWGFYQDNVLVAGSGFVFGQALNKTYSFTKSAAGSHTYLLRFRGIAGAHGFPPYTEVSITVNVSSPPPAAPTNLVATAISTSEIKVQWTDNSNNETGFELWFSYDGTNFYLYVPLVYNTTNYSHIQPYLYTVDNEQGLPGGFTCYYKVRAHNNAGYSNYSNIDGATTPLETPTRLEAKIISDSQVELSWLDESHLEDGFKVERKIGETGEYAQIAIVARDTTGEFASMVYTDSGLLPATQYYYRVKAYNQIAESPYSNEAVVTTFPKIPTIDDLSALLTYYYQQGAIKNKGIYNSLLAKLKGGLGQLNAFLNELKAQDNKGISHNAVTALTAQANEIIDYSHPPSTPTGLSANALSAEQVALHWTDNSNNEISFKIEWKESLDGVYQPLVTVGPNVTGYIDTSYFPLLHNDKTQYYRIYAFNNMGSSLYSNEASVNPTRIPPKFPHRTRGDFADNETPSSFTISWLDADNEDGYEIARSLDGQTYEPIAMVGKDVMFYTDSGLQPSTTYLYRVRAYNTAGYNDYLTQGTTLPMPPFALPQTLQLYLYYIPNESAIIAPNGETLITSLEGSFALQLSTTVDPETASISIISSSCWGTPIIYQGIDSGVLFFSENPDNPSAGTLNMRTGHIDITQRLLVNSSYLESVGLAPLPMEIHHTGTFCPMQPQYANIQTTERGTIPYNVPVLGGATLATQNTSNPTKPTTSPTPPPKHAWTKKDKFELDGITVFFTITRNLDCTLTITFTATGVTETLPSIIHTWLNDSANGYVTWFQGVISSVEVATGLVKFGKIFIVDMAATGDKKGVYWTIQFVKKRITRKAADGTIITDDNPGWQVDQPISPQDPRYAGRWGRQGAGAGFSLDHPGLRNIAPEPPGWIEVSYEFRTLVIDTGPPLELIGYFAESFSYIIDISSAGISIRPGSASRTGPGWVPGPPDPTIPGVDDWFGLLRKYPPPYGQGQGK